MPFPTMEHLIYNKEECLLSSLNRLYRFIPSLISLSLLLFLSGCSDTSSNSNSSMHINTMISSLVRSNPLSYTFELPAQQKLRDISGNFSVHTGADTGIFLLPDEKVEILVSGSAQVQPGGNLTGPEGAPTCLRSELPEPTLPCYSVVYSIGIDGRAGEVGSLVGFNPTTKGNLFLGVNAVNVGADAGSFSVTVLIIPKGKMTGMWVAPQDGFALQGVSTVLSAFVFAPDAIIDSVQFTIAIAGERDVQLCNAHSGSGDTYSCTWQFKQPGKILSNGLVTFGFVLKAHSQSGKPLAPEVNPAGIRTGAIRYVLSLDGIYAGYAATDLNGTAKYQKVIGSWVIPQVRCAPGEKTAMGVWVGMTNGNSDEGILAQLGTESDCQDGRALYGLWWEMYPAPSVPLKRFVLPGDTVTASVAFQNGTFRLSIDDPRWGIHFSTTQPGNVSDTSIAECIVEAPESVNTPSLGGTYISPLSEFDNVQVSCQLNGTKPIADGPQDILYQMQKKGISQATTSNLDEAGSGFTVQWKHS